MIIYNYWQIWINNMWEDTVSYDSSMSEEEVKESLINHDNYPENIVLKLEGNTNDYWRLEYESN
tara:strand:+ start:653 stop:844 length:192 start_codon:yes stop_codon:yes gene_type:complete